MTRRQALALVLAALLVAGGRLVRYGLLFDGTGRWRDPLWLDSLLPPAAGESLPGRGQATADSAAPGRANDGAQAPAGPAAAQTSQEETAGDEPSRQATKSLANLSLNVNHCGVDSLTLLPGVGPVLAGRIVDERAQRGPFRDLADLQRVKGIGPRLAARLAPHLRFASETASPATVPDRPATR